jgi:hypothetical protein
MFKDFQPGKQKSLCPLQTDPRDPLLHQTSAPTRKSGNPNPIHPIPPYSLNLHPRVTIYTLTHIPNPTTISRLISVSPSTSQLPTENGDRQNSACRNSHVNPTWTFITRIGDM